MPLIESPLEAGADRQWRLVGSLVLRTLVLYALLLALWPVWKEAYGRAYAGAGQLFFSSFGSAGEVRFHHVEAGGPFDVHAELHNRRTRSAVLLRFSSRYVGYELAVLVGALVLAMPLPWGRRLRALAWALLWVHLFMAFALGLSLLNTFSNGDRLAVIHLPGPLKFLLGLTTVHLAVRYTLPHVAVLLIWGLTTIRRGDLDALLGRAGPGRPATPKPSRRKARKVKRAGGRGGR